MIDVPMDFDIYKSLIELEPEQWDPDSLSPLQAQMALKLAGKPLRKLAPPELEALIAENLGLPFLVPLAVERLREEPFLQAARHPGDLLTTVMEVDLRFWLERYDLWLTMIEILEEAVRQINARIEAEGREKYLPWHLGDDFMGALLHFRGIHRV